MTAARPTSPLRSPVMDLVTDHPYMTTDAPRILSLGAGVDSTTLALLAIDGVLPRYDAAVFADTGWEPAAVYEHLERLRPVLEAAGTPVHIVTVGNIRDDALSSEHRFASMPLFTQEPPTADSDGRGMVRRQCTSEYKLKPIKAKIRELLGAPLLEGGRTGRVGGRPGERYAWNVVGIAAEEVVRIKPSDVRYLRRVDPLVDILATPWARVDCERWLAGRWAHPVPRSACVGCPFHTNLEWRRMRDEDPAGWADAVRFDRALRSDAAGVNMPHLRGLAYLHSDRVPLDEANIDRLSNAERRAAQGGLFDELPGCSPWGCERGPDEDVDPPAPVPVDITTRPSPALVAAARTELARRAEARKATA